MRVFVAIDMGDMVRAEAARVVQTISGKIEAVKTPPKIAWVKPDALHLTLRFIGEVADEIVPALCERLAPPIALACSPRRASRVPCGLVSWPLLPHLTVGRVKMAGAGVDWPKILQAQDVRSARSPVDRVTLYRRHLSQRSPHYTGLMNAALVASTQ